MHHRAAIHTCCHIYTHFTVDFLLNAELCQISLPFSPKMSFPPSQAHRFNQTDNRRIGTISLTRTGSACVCMRVYFSLQGEREDKVFYSDSDVQTVKNVNACVWISVQNINGTHLVHMVSEV